jgi:hypothetical protein
MAMRFKPPQEKDEAQELLRQEQSITAPKVGARRTSRSGAGGGAGRGPRRLRIYLLRDSKAQPVEVELGITDGSKTEVKGGEVKENDVVIIGMASGSAAQSQSGITNPFQAGPMRFR